MNPLVTVDRRDGYAVVRLGRPEKKNAMNRQARWELLAALTSLRDKKAIILTGDGDSFCSGVDLKEVRSDAESGVSPDPQFDWIEVCLGRGRQADRRLRPDDRSARG